MKIKKSHFLPLHKSEKGGAGFQGFCLCIMIICFIAASVSVISTQKNYFQRKADFLNAQKAYIDMVNQAAVLYAKRENIKPGHALPLSALQALVIEAANTLGIRDGRTDPSGAIYLYSRTAPAEGEPYAAVGYPDFKKRVRIWYPTMPKKHWSDFNFFEEMNASPIMLRSVAEGSAGGGVR